ncbi:MAG: hypothetical protein SStaBPW_06360 [Shewanella algae]
MIQGLENFRVFFEGFEDRYTLIGGVACHLSMTEAGFNFRATKDLDIVLCAEALDSEFVKKFWEFIKEGEYEHQEKSSEGKQFYRFIKPKSDDFPFMLELFSRKPDDLLLEISNNLTPIPTDEEVSSLSAILLDDAYYECIQDGKEIVNNLPILKPEYIIPFKMKAWLDLTTRKNNGEQIDSRNIKKHKNDVLKLSQLLSPGLTVKVSDNIKKDVSDFINEIKKEDVDTKALGIKGLTCDNICDLLSSIYL